MARMRHVENKYLKVFLSSCDISTFGSRKEGESVHQELINVSTILKIAKVQGSSNHMFKMA